MEHLFTTEQQQQHFETAQTYMNEGRLNESEELLHLVIESAQQNGDDKTFTSSMILLMRILVNTQRYSEVFPFLERINPYIQQYATIEEKFLYRIQVAIFNYIHGIGDPITEFEKLLEESLQTDFLQIRVILINNLLDVYFEHRMFEKGITLYEASRDFFKYVPLDERFAHTPFLFLINSFRVFYVRQNYEKCQQIMDEIDKKGMLQKASSFAVLYYGHRALLEIRTNRHEEAFKHFEQFCSMMTIKYYFLIEIEWWVEALKDLGHLEKVIEAQQFALDALKEHVKLEEHTKRVRLINQMSKRDYEESLYTDYLTNIKNRNFYEDMLSKEQKFKNFTLAVVDIDHFKSVNDTYGHTVGDQAIRFIAKHLKEWCPKHDISLIRYGGDEFILLMPYSFEEMYPLLQALHRHILTTPFLLRGTKQQMHLSISMGIGYTAGNYLCLKALFNQADTALYEAKQSRGTIMYTKK